MDTAQKIKIMQAFLDGQRVEYKDPCTGWREITNGILSPTWNWERDDYRIKKKTEYFTHDIYCVEAGGFIKKTVDIKALEDALKIIKHRARNLNTDQVYTLKTLKELVKSQ